MKKYVIDTNALLKNSKLYDDERFSDGEFYIPIAVISELDNIKSDKRISEGNIKFKARTASREIEKRLKEGNLNILKSNNSYTDESFNTWEVIDDLIISSAKKLQEETSDDDDVILISSDLNVRLKAEGLGLISQNYSTENMNMGISDMYSGVIEIEVYRNKIDDFYRNGYIKWEEITESEPYPNQFLIGSDNSGSKGRIIAIYKKNTGYFQKLRYGENNFWGENKAKDIYQKFALELIFDPDVKIVTISAPQGSGKTYLSVGALLDQVQSDKYSKLLIGKDTTPLSKWNYQGFTTGSTEEKLLTHFNNYLTTLENLSENKKINGSQYFENLRNQNMLDILDISSVLGSSFDGKAIILDEFQSCDLRTARSCLTRISDNCKLIVCGDILQQTMTNLGKEDSALFASIEWLKEVEGVGHISLKNIHRGKIVEDVAKAFDKKMYG